MFACRKAQGESAPEPKNTRKRVRVFLFVWCVRRGSNPDRKRRRLLWYPIPPRAQIENKKKSLCFTGADLAVVFQPNFRAGFADRKNKQNKRRGRFPTSSGGSSDYVQYNTDFAICKLSCNRHFGKFCRKGRFRVVNPDKIC